MVNKKSESAAPIQPEARAQLFAEAKKAGIHWSGHGHTTQWWVNKATSLKQELLTLGEKKVAAPIHSHGGRVAPGPPFQGLTQTMDARVWAREFERTFGHLDTPDEGTMLGWFANAIMTGYDEANQRSQARASQPRPSAGLDKLLDQISLIANSGSVEDFTVAGIRARLRDVLYQFKVSSAGQTRGKP